MRTFRLVAIFLATLAVTLVADSQSGSAAGEEAAVRATATKEVDGWLKFDAAQIASCYTVDATWQNPFGVRARSRAALEKFLTTLFQSPGYRSAKDTSPPRITDIHMLSATSAAVWSEEKSAGQIDEAGKPMAPRFSHYLEVLVKVDGKWLISDSIIMDEYPSS